MTPRRLVVLSLSLMCLSMAVLLADRLITPAEHPSTGLGINILLVLGFFVYAWQGARQVRHDRPTMGNTYRQRIAWIVAGAHVGFSVGLLTGVLQEFFNVCRTGALARAEFIIGCGVAFAVSLYGWKVSK